MLEITLTFLSFILCLLLARSKASIILVFSIYIFYFILMLGYFHINKLGGTYLPLFPDEETYINNRSLKIYAFYVNTLYEQFGPWYFKLTNILIYTIPLIIIYNKYSKIDTSCVFGVILFSIGSYWCFFILKEAYSISGLLFLLYGISIRNKLYIFLGCTILILARPENIFLVLLSYIVYFLNHKNKLFLYSFIISILLLIVLFLKLPLSIAIKLSFVSRRNGASAKEYDPEAISAANKEGLDFIISKEYIDTILQNFNSSFNIFTNSFGIATLLVLINVISLALCLYHFRKKHSLIYIDWFYLISVIVLTCTHSMYRYANAISLPYIALRLIKNRNKNENLNNESK
ncbi:hypothetical protein [Providencia sp. PROV152]|uniref:Wzy n=1 Tax=Providencia stuartii TaxID=588 RepID=A0AAI9I3H0_PROST|nr:hypothetical protein [Providencia sp. PROV152]ELR5037791.1 hypothetical protein [Providencia stuartii]